jgi:hypothetical protein
MNDFLKNLMVKHKGNMFFLVLCSLLSAGTSFVTTNQQGWLEDDIKLLIEHHLEERYGMSPGTLEGLDSKIKAKNAQTTQKKK